MIDTAGLDYDPEEEGDHGDVRETLPPSGRIPNYTPLGMFHDVIVGGRI